MNIEQERFTVLCITNKKLVYRSSGGISHAFIPVHGVYVDFCVCVVSQLSLIISSIIKSTILTAFYLFLT